MRYVKLGNSNLKVSVVGLGTWAIGGDFWGNVNDKQSIKTIQKAIDCGINLIDTAPAYGNGHAEEIVGKAIKNKREKVIIATKCGIVKDEFSENKIHNLEPKSIRKEIDLSLKRLQVEVIDLYQIHWPDNKTPLEETVNELIKIKKAGKIKHIGVSNFDVPLLEKITSMTEVISTQPQYSLLSRDIERDILPFCKDNKLGVLTYGSLGAGVLTGKYQGKPAFEKGDLRKNFYPFFREPLWSKAQKLVECLKEIAIEADKSIAHVAINWVNQQKGITTALVGAKTPKQAKENAAAGSWELSEEQLKLIDKKYNDIYR